MKLLMIRRRATLIGLTVAVLGLAVALPSLSLASTKQHRASGKSIVWLELGSGNPYWDAQHQAADAYLSSLGYSFKAVSGQGKPESQSATLRQLADQGTTVVMLNPVDPKALVPAVKYARSKGTKVLSVYATMPSANASVVFDEIRSGRVAAEYAATLLKKRYGKLTGKVAVLEGILGQPASDLRAKGFIDWMKSARRRRSSRRSRPTGPPTRRPRRCRTGSSSTRTWRWSTASATRSPCPAVTVAAAAEPALHAAVGLDEEQELHHVRLGRRDLPERGGEGTALRDASSTRPTGPATRSRSSRSTLAQGQAR